MGGGGEQRFPQGFSREIRPQPILIVEHGERRALALPKVGAVLVLALFGEPAREAGRGRQGDEGREPRQIALELLHHLLDQEIAEGDAAQPVLAIRDRIEDGGRRLRRPRSEPGPPREARRWRRDTTVVSATSTKIKRLVDELGMEEGEAAPVRRLETVAQILPGADLVHGLVADDLLENIGGRRPIDRPQHQKARIEPGGEEMREVGIDAVELSLLLQGAQQLLAHAHQRGGAALARGSAVGSAPGDAARRRNAIRAPPSRSGSAR